jgi:hypothetical protein
MKHIKKYINFNNYEEEKNIFKIGDMVKLIDNNDYYYYNNYNNKWIINQYVNEIFTITKIKKCHELKTDGYHKVYRTPCDKGEYLGLFKYYWPWYPLKNFIKID